MIENRLYTNHIQYDTWEQTDAALRLMNKALTVLQDSKPDEKKEPEKYKRWAEEHREFQVACSEINYRRIDMVRRQYK